MITTLITSRSIVAGVVSSAIFGYELYKGFHNQISQPSLKEEVNSSSVESQNSEQLSGLEADLFIE